MPYHNFGSCKIYGELATHAFMSHTAYLGVLQVVQSLLVCSIGFLEVVHHEIAVA